MPTNSTTKKKQNRQSGEAAHSGNASGIKPTQVNELEVFDSLLPVLKKERPEIARQSPARYLAEQRYDEIEELRKKHSYTFKALAARLSESGLKISAHQLENALSTVRAVARKRQAKEQSANEKTTRGVKKTG